MINYNYLYNKQYYKDYINSNYYVNRKLSYKIIKNGFVLPGDGHRHCGVADANKRYIESTNLFNGFFEGYSFSKHEPLYKDETVIFIGSILDVWGHWLTDNVKRLWFLFTDDYKKKYKDCKLVFVACDSKIVISDNVKQLLSLIGIDYSKLIQIDNVIQYRQIIIPDECFYNMKNDKQIDENERYYTSEYVDIINRINTNFANHYLLKYENNKYYEKIYFSYRKIGRKIQLGENELESFFMKEGYKILYPEDYDFYTQLYFLKKCKYFSSTIGSCSHNILFLNDDTNIILIPRAAFIGGYQFAITDIVSKNRTVNYIDSSLSLMINQKHIAKGPFFYYISDELNSFFNHNVASHHRLFLIYLLFSQMCSSIDTNSKYFCYYLDKIKKPLIFIKPSKTGKKICRAIFFYINRFI